jgi:hypothetical protein
VEGEEYHLKMPAHKPDMPAWQPAPEHRIPTSKDAPRDKLVAREEEEVSENVNHQKPLVIHRNSKTPLRITQPVLTQISYIQYLSQVKVVIQRQEIILRVDMVKFSRIIEEITVD